MLAGQEHRNQVPAGLPAGTYVAHKTGWVPGVAHDVALVRPDGLPPLRPDRLRSTDEAAGGDALRAQRRHQRRTSGRGGPREPHRERHHDAADHRRCTRRSSPRCAATTTAEHASSSGRRQRRRHAAAARRRRSGRSPASRWPAPRPASSGPLGPLSWPAATPTTWPACAAPSQRAVAAQPRRQGRGRRRAARPRRPPARVTAGPLLGGTDAAGADRRHPRRR